MVIAADCHAGAVPRSGIKLSKKQKVKSFLPIEKDSVLWRASVIEWQRARPHTTRAPSHVSQGQLRNYLAILSSFCWPSLFSLHLHKNSLKPSWIHSIIYQISQDEALISVYGWLDGKPPFMTWPSGVTDLNHVNMFNSPQCNAYALYLYTSLIMLMLYNYGHKRALIYPCYQEYMYIRL